MIAWGNYDLPGASDRRPGWRHAGLLGWWAVPLWRRLWPCTWCIMAAFRLPTVPVAKQVAYCLRGTGRIGENWHWTTQVSENTKEWRRASRYCQRTQSNEGRVRGCGVVNELREGGY